jgi:hypothetical protein
MRSLVLYDVVYIRVENREQRGNRLQMKKIFQRNVLYIPAATHKARTSNSASTPMRLILIRMWNG